MTSTIKVNTITTESGSTLTLGESGKTVTLASGASQTGFGRTGTVNWQTTIKTAGFTAATGEGYFLNTTSGGFSVNLPAGSVGDIVAFKDYLNTWNTGNVTVVPNGTDKIGGTNANATLNTQTQSVTLIFTDSTRGWLDIHDSTSNIQGQAFVTATGGNATLTNGDFKTHIFTSPGTFCVSCGGSPGGSSTVDYLVVAGGGSSGGGGGGGGGGFRISNSTGCVPAPTMSPLVAPAALPVTAQGYPITIGAGGAGVVVASPSYCTPRTQTSGSNSIFSTITSQGGGAGAVYSSPSSPNKDGFPGGSGGGGAYGPSGPAPGAAGSGNTPPVSPPQGNNGGTGDHSPGVWANTGGGGGAGAAGTNGAPGSPGAGGIGSFLADTVIGPTAPSYGTPGPVSSTRYFAGGGGFCAPGGNACASTGISGGGGKPFSSPTNPSTYKAGTTNTGGGGGGGSTPGPPATAGGGSGIVIIRYKFQ